ncbi:unnamed protein product [Didymodactylos carnosus]|uniref:Uncharacterized protein n=1 Tax=Didymodactylos carnosus TaxID=1234261 RepID=A0A815JED4_9BILA|nr:unnamed protein product [Didymodactylos carnosus]CAF4275631.1 unnamed protein product [Didymodactylos carnosus]
MATASKVQSTKCAKNAGIATCDGLPKNCVTKKCVTASRILLQSAFNLDEWKNIDAADIDNLSEVDEDSDDAASDLISEEEKENSSSISEDNTDVNVIVYNESDSDCDIDREFSSLKLNEYNSPLNHQLKKSIKKFEL